MIGTYLRIPSIILILAMIAITELRAVILGLHLEAGLMSNGDVIP